MPAVLATMAASLVLILPPVWWGIQAVVGDPIARKYGVAEEISVVATKKDSARRRRCDMRVQGAALGWEICLTRDEFDRMPDQVTVALRIRRSALGYHVDTQTIVPPTP